MDYLKKNPELQKNIWLELSSQRLIVMPVIIMAILVLVSMNSNDVSEKLRMGCHWGMVIILVLWGSKVAHDNIINEYNERTWDWQRMCALTPKQLLIGKLFGATIYNWYGGLICFVLGLFFAAGTNNVSFSTALADGLSVLAQAISLMCVCMILALIRIQKGNGRDKLKGGMVLGVLFIYLIGSFGTFITGWVNSLNFWGTKDEVNHLNNLLENLFYAAWALVGLHQALRKELNYKNTSWLWYGFIISSSIVKGLSWSSLLKYEHFTSFIWVSFATHAVVLFYVLLIFEAKEITQLKILFKNIKEKNFNYLNYNAPLWLLTFPLVFISLMFLAFVNLDNLSRYSFYNNTYALFYGTIISTAMFIIRDFALMLLLSIGSKNKRVEAAFILYLFLLYYVAPMLTFDNEFLVCFFRPSSTMSYLGFLCPAVEAAILFFMIKEQKNWKQLVG